jgi:hypothetical protein
MKFLLITNNWFWSLSNYESQPLLSKFRYP